ncbi:MAG: chitooligosaccharide deacetylase [Ruminococcaceae bacterium]|nr:chitooligosaccharide deacetylase [Oscillospiraceae bacterium]
MKRKYGTAFICCFLSMMLCITSTAAHTSAWDKAGGNSIQESMPSETEKDIIFYKKANQRMEIALTFDDGPHPYYTPIILKILEEYGIKATFFMIGENISYYPAAAEAVLAAGHEIGNHTNHHKGMKALTDHEIRKEIEDCEDVIFSLAEYKPTLIRPPEGAMNDQVRRVIGDLRYRIILWDVDTRDWAHTPPKEICRHVLQEIEAGDIILMHDFIGHNSPTPQALRLMIPALLDKGYKFVTVGELLDGS